MSVPYSAAIEDLLPDAVRRRVRAARRAGSASEPDTSPTGITQAPCQLFWTKQASRSRGATTAAPPLNPACDTPSLQHQDLFR
jgi:hypothetical protein